MRHFLLADMFGKMKEATLKRLGKGITPVQCKSIMRSFAKQITALSSVHWKKTNRLLSSLQSNF